MNQNIIVAKPERFFNQLLIEIKSKHDDLLSNVDKVFLRLLFVLEFQLPIFLDSFVATIGLLKSDPVNDFKKSLIE